MWVSEYFRSFKKFKIKHLLYASSSSVYGINREKLDESKPSEHPISVYAATKNPMKCLHMFIVIYSIYLLQD